MHIGLRSTLTTNVVLALTVVVAALLSTPVLSQGRGAGQGRGGAGGQQTAPAVPQISRTPPVDQAAHDRGRALWAMHCVNCHGSQARGSENGPNLIRTRTVNFDRAAEAGSVLGPFLKQGHPTDSGKASASFTSDEVVALANFLRQRVNDTMRGSPVFTVGDILVGDAKAGEAYFSGDGGCASCHTAAAHTLAGIGTRMTPVDLQQRMLFPASGRGFGGGGRGGAAGGRGAAAPTETPNPNAVTVTITPASGPGLSGVLVEESDFFITFRDASGQIRVVRRVAGMKVTKTNPLQAHIDLLDRITDTQIHDLVAYLETMK
jgi:mono/diheme cytochrome c family protein